MVAYERAVGQGQQRLLGGGIFAGKGFVLVWT